MPKITRAAKRGFALALSAFTLACSGGDAREELGDASAVQTQANAPHMEDPTSLAIPEGVGSVDYQVFQKTAVSESPRKLIVRVVGMESAGTLELARTLQVALDSLGRADSTAVAMRGILYVIHAEDRMHGRLVPRIWGEWLPPSGWEAASPPPPAASYTTAIYAEQPPWHGDAAPSTGEVNGG